MRLCQYKKIFSLQALYGPPPGYEGGGGLPEEPEWVPSGGRGRLSIISSQVNNDLLTGFDDGTIRDLLRCCGLMWSADYKT